MRRPHGALCGGDGRGRSAQVQQRRQRDADRDTDQPDEHMLKSRHDLRTFLRGVVAKLPGLTGMIVADRLQARDIPCASTVVEDA